MRPAVVLFVTLGFVMASALGACSSSSGGSEPDAGTTDAVSKAKDSAPDRSPIVRDAGGTGDAFLEAGSDALGDGAGSFDASTEAASDAATGGRDATSVDGGDAGTGAEAGASFLEGGLPSAAHVPTVADLGGSVLASPKYQLIAYSSDPSTTDVANFINEFGGEPAWSMQTAEYGVGALTSLPTILITSAPPATIDDNSTGSGLSPFEQTLVDNTTGPNPPWGAADPSTVYMFLIPVGQEVESSGTCCESFYGYHYEAAVTPTMSLPYALICNCGALAPYTALQELTSTVNHEMVEAATDPFPVSAPAYYQTDQADEAWTTALGGEIADMCDDNTDTIITPPGATYSIQRSWSNAAALGGTNPCVPAPTAPYFNSYPTYDDTLASWSGQQTIGLRLGVGATKTIDVVLASRGPTSGPWEVAAYDYDEYNGLGSAKTTVSLDRTGGESGDVLHLTITVNSYDSNLGGAGVVLESTLNGEDNLTMFAVGS